ncbi:MAG: glycosyltransferase [Symploca sp. SIO3C6]|uniref:Glycosyltransferase n=1 Tax=Symploca sp. SIO1C4 TaxID=2607765 RepID=A0A6B3MYK1_9CYAN|nr:glycosyltransferase [Symploca sp. SIO3C6]NER26496.1 glycosyltransferase [Symploca sp. SIO1C4]
MEIAFLIRSLNYGGAERQLVTLVKALDKKRLNTTVLVFYSGGTLAQELKDSGIQLISLEKRGRWDVVSFWWRLFQQLKRINPDALHSYLGVPNLLTIFLKPLLPSTKMIWGVRASNVDWSRYDWLSHLSFQLECLFSRFADLIIVNSNAGRVYHQDHGFPEQKMIVIPNGIDTERFKPNSGDRVRLRAEWRIPEETILIGLVGRLDPMKDHPTFLKTAALMCQQRQNIYFVCVGSGAESYTQTLYQLTRDLNISEQLIWAGVRSDMPVVYNALDIDVSSSYGEGFPNVIGEAMACGVPCVVTDVGDSAWIVGDTGMVVPPKDPELLKAAIEKLIERIHSDAYNNNLIRQRVIEKFSLLQLVTKTQTTLLELVYGFQQK